MNTGRQLWQLLTTLPALLLDAIDRYVQRQHGPYDLYGDGLVAVCRLCGVDWPCDEFVDAQARMDKRFEERL
jgi:short subunit dehydrogenase-like uncharacterized protein